MTIAFVGFALLAASCGDSGGLPVAGTQSVDLTTSSSEAPATSAAGLVAQTTEPPVPNAGETTPPTQAPFQTPAPSPNAQPQGESLSLAYLPVVDPLAGNVEAVRFLAPTNWAISGDGIVWNIGMRNGGVSLSMQVNDTQRNRGFGYIPYLPRHWSEPQQPGFPEGSVYGILGSVVTRPMTAVDYINSIVIPENFPQGTEIIGSQTLPEVARGVAATYGYTSTDAGRTRIRFNNGAGDVEAHVYAWMSYDILGDTTLWTPVNVYIVYAEDGQLDAEAPLLNTMALSAVVNPKWAEVVLSVERLRIDGNAQNQRQMEQLIATLRETSNAIFDITSQVYRDRQAANDVIFQDYAEAIRGTETFVDPGVGPVELPGGFQQVWATGTGEYILSNDALFDPNLNSRFSWQEIVPD